MSRVTYYSSPSLIKPLYLPRNGGHIRDVAFFERETYDKYINSSNYKEFGHAVLERVAFF